MTAQARAETDNLRLDDGLEPSLGTVLGFRRWPVTPEALADAGSQAVPFTGDDQATDRAWAARVDEALQGLNVLDPEGLDDWMGAHAASQAPHLLEADLVAAWDTWLTHAYQPPAPLDHQPLDVEPTGLDAASDVEVDTDDDADGWP